MLRNIFDFDLMVTFLVEYFASGAKFDIETTNETRRREMGQTRQLTVFFNGKYLKKNYEGYTFIFISASMYIKVCWYSSSCRIQNPESEVETDSTANCYSCFSICYLTCAFTYIYTYIHTYIQIHHHLYTHRV